jgi:hypothetical protein
VIGGLIGDRVIGRSLDRVIARSGDLVIGLTSKRQSDIPTSLSFVISSSCKAPENSTRRSHEVAMRDEPLSSNSSIERSSLARR